MGSRIALTVDDIKRMDDKQVYDLVSDYLKGRLADFVVSAEDEMILADCDLPPQERDEEYDAVLWSVKSELKKVLWNEEVVERYEQALSRMCNSVKEQLNRHGSSNPSWKRGASLFYRQVSRELEKIRDRNVNSVRVLLDAIEEHRNADDADVADQELYRVADEVREEIGDLDG